MSRETISAALLDNSSHRFLRIDPFLRLIHWPRIARVTDVTPVNAVSFQRIATIRDGEDITLEFFWDDAPDRFEDLFDDAEGDSRTIHWFVDQRWVLAPVLIRRVERHHQAANYVAGTVTLLVDGEVTEQTGWLAQFIIEGNATVDDGTVDRTGTFTIVGTATTDDGGVDRTATFTVVGAASVDDGTVDRTATLTFTGSASWA